MTAHTEEKNYAPLWKKLTVAGAVAATVAGLMVSQNLTQVRASETSEYISVTEFSAGTTHATILSTDGKAYSRGWNNLGQLGVQAGSKVNVSEWTEINTPEKLTTVKASDHTVALSESGKLYTWGPNSSGQIGNGTTTTAFTPTPITAVDRYSKVASGSAFTLALDSEGRLWTWGANNAGQLGDGTTTDRSIPNMVGGEAVFAEIYASKDTAYAIDRNGKLWAWGANNEGQIGDGTITNRNKPAIVDTTQTWSRLAVSQENGTVLAIDRSGWLFSWGANTNGLLGNGADWRALQEAENVRFKNMIAQIEREDIIRKNALIEKCVADALQTALTEYDIEYETMSKARDEAEKKAKEKEEEEKNKPTPSPSATPSASPSPSATPSASPSPTPSEEPIPDPDKIHKPVRADFTSRCITDVEKTFAKTDTSGMKAAVITEPALKEGHKRPELVTSKFQVKDIAVGSENAYTVDTLNRLHSWGKDANGQTGLGLEDDKSLTQVPVQVKEGITDVDAGTKYGVAVDTNGNLLLWGVNNTGVLMSKPSDEPKLLTPTVKGNGYTAVTAGLTTVYGFKNQTVYVWGNNTNGELGSGSTEGAPYSPSELERKLLSIAPSSKGAVALGTTNQLMYWGLNDSGQFGNSRTSTEPERKASSNEIAAFTGIASGEGYTTAIASDGRLWGWGSNARKLINLSGAKDQSYPVVVSTGFDKVTAVAAGKNVSAVTNGSVLSIWAAGVAHNYDLADIVDLAAGDDHIVARNNDGKVWNWSLNQSGIREGTEAQTLTPVDDRSYSSIAAGGTTSGAITEAGEAVIWGAGSENLRLAETEGTPVANFTFNNLSIGYGYVLASDKNNVLWGWGESRYLVLGSKSVSKFPTVLTSQQEANDEAKEGK
jgi:alpha-tubulin suppressor-like RCC1 family protein